MVSRKHLRGNGLLLLGDLVQTYRPKQVPEMIAAKIGEFWSQLKRFPNETVDNYYNHFQELLDDLLETNEAISTESAIRQFIFTLGPKFGTIQNNFRIGNLPPEWHTEDWPTLLVLCRNYSNSVNSQALLKCDHPKPTGGSDGTNHDHANHHKKVRKWFPQPIKVQS